MTEAPDWIELKGKVGILTYRGGKETASLGIVKRISAKSITVASVGRPNLAERYPLPSLDLVFPGAWTGHEQLVPLSDERWQRARARQARAEAALGLKQLIDRWALTGGDDYAEALRHALSGSTAHEVAARTREACTALPT